MVQTVSLEAMERKLFAIANAMAILTIVKIPGLAN